MSSHVILSSIITLGNFMEDVLLIELLANFRSGSFNGILFLTVFLWNKVYLVFTFSHNLLAMNQRLIFSSSIFTVGKSALTPLLEGLCYPQT